MAPHRQPRSGVPQHQPEMNMMQFDGEARFRRDLTQRNLGALRREGFQPARRHPSASRHRYPSRAHTDDELEELSDNNLGRAQNSNGYHSDGFGKLACRVKRESSSELEDHAVILRKGVRREYSNGKYAQHVANAKSKSHRSLSAPPVRIGAIVPQCSAEQVSRVSSEMKMARAASAAHFITSKSARAEDDDVFAKTEIQDLFAWLQTISLQEYLPVLLQMGIEKISHLSDLEAEDVHEAGMTRPERKRFLRKQAELAFEREIRSVHQPVQSEEAVSELGERAFSNISDPDSVVRPTSAQNSHRSQISVISAASSCKPQSDKDCSGVADFFTPQPSSVARSRPTNTIDLAALEQCAHAICRIQRLDDDFDLGFGFLRTVDGRFCIVTCLDVLRAREDAAQATAVFSDGQGLQTCRLDADAFWCSSQEIGYCAVGAVFDSPEDAAKFTDAPVSNGSCKCEDSVVVCHWGEIDKQFTIHKIVRVSAKTVNFPVRGGLKASSGTPIFAGNLLLALSIGHAADDGVADGTVTAVRADAIIADLRRQSQVICSKSISKSDEEEARNKDCTSTTPVGNEAHKKVASCEVAGEKSRFAPPSPADEAIVDPMRALRLDLAQQQHTTKVSSSLEGMLYSNSHQTSVDRSRRPPRPLTTLPCLSLPCMSGGTIGFSGSEIKDPNCVVVTQPASFNAPSIQTFGVAQKVEVHQVPSGVALNFQERFPEEDSASIHHEKGIVEIPSFPEQRESGCRADDCPDKDALSPEGREEEALSQNDTDQNSREAQVLPTAREADTEPLSARSHHEPKEDEIVGEPDSVEKTGDDALEKVEEAKGVLSELQHSTVSVATAMLTRHASSPGIVQATLHRLDELCSESEANRSEALQAGTVTSVLETLHPDAHQNSVDIHACALSVLSSLSFTKELQMEIVGRGGIGCILRVMKTQHGSAKIQFRACRALCNISYESGDIQLQMVGEGCIPILTSAMDKFLSSAKVQAEGCGVFCNLAANNESNYKLILEHGGLSAVVQAMSMHGSQLGVLYKGCSALCSLTMVSSCHSQAMDEGAASTVIKSMLMHPDNNELLYKGCGVLANLSQTPQFAAIIAKQGGVAAVVKGLTGSSSDLRLQCKGLRALHIMSKCRETHAQMVRQGAIEAALQLMMVHQHEVEVQERACAILSCTARDRTSIDKTAWQLKGVEAIMHAMLTYPSNEIIVTEGSNALATLSLYEGAKTKIMQSSLLSALQDILESRRMPAVVHTAVNKLQRSLYPTDSFLLNEAPDTRDAIRRSKMKGDQRPISATLQAVSRPPRPFSASVSKRVRRPASATFASGSAAMLVKDLRRGLGKENTADSNLVLQHQIEELRNEAETLRHENLKMLTGAAGSIAALRDVHGLPVGATIKRRPASALRAVSPYGALSAAPLRPPSGRSIRVSKESKARPAVKAATQQAPQLEPLKDVPAHPGSMPAVDGQQVEGNSTGTAHHKMLERDPDVTDRIHRLIETGRTNEQVARHYSLLDFGITAQEVATYRQAA